jgi:hypothetical protein
MTTNNTHPATGVQKRIGLRRISQTQWVLVAMIIGVTVGYLFPDGPNANAFRASFFAAASTKLCGTMCSSIPENEVFVCASSVPVSTVAAARFIPTPGLTMFTSVLGWAGGCGLAAGGGVAGCCARAGAPLAAAAPHRTMTRSRRKQRLMSGSKNRILTAARALPFTQGRLPQASSGSAHRHPKQVDCGTFP